MNKQLKKDIIKWGEAIHDACKSASNQLPKQYKRYIHPDLNGACAIVSYFLRKKILTKYDIEVNFIGGSYKGLTHCWLEIDNVIIDTTKTQFHSKAKKVSFSVSKKNYKKIADNKSALQQTKEWNWQSPYLYKLKWTNQQAELELK